MYKVSVITTLYNYRNYIKDCIESFLKQDFLDSEMIIVDDGSSDKPHKTIKKYECDRIKYIRLDRNYGYSHAKNVGINQSNSEILVMLDADDMVTENGITVRYNKMQEGYDFVHGPCWDYSVRSNGSTKKRESRLKKQWEKSKKKSYKFVHAQGVMLKKSIHRKIGLYDEDLRSKSDREMWARIFHHKFKIGYVPEFVSLYRRHSKQMHRSPEKRKINKVLQSRVKSLIAQRKKKVSGVIFLDLEVNNGNKG